MRFEEVIEKYNPSFLKEANIVDFIIGLQNNLSAKNRKDRDISEDQEVIILLDPKNNINRLKRDLNYDSIIDFFKKVSSTLNPPVAEKDFDFKITNSADKIRLPDSTEIDNIYYSPTNPQETKERLEMDKAALRLFDIFYTKFTWSGTNVISWDELSTGQLRGQKSSRGLNIGFLDYLHSPMNIEETKSEMRKVISYYSNLNGSNIKKYLLGIDKKITRKESMKYTKEGIFKTAIGKTTEYAKQASSSGYDKLTSDIGLMGTRYG